MKSPTEETNTSLPQSQSKSIADTAIPPEVFHNESQTNLQNEANATPEEKGPEFMKGIKLHLIITG